MVAFLERVKVNDPVTTNDYHFLTTKGIYTVEEIASVVGIVGPTPDDNFGDQPIVTIKELIRANIIVNFQVRLKDPNVASTQFYVKHLHADASKYPTINGLVGKIWPIGKGAGFEITEILTPSRLKSRF